MMKKKYSYYLLGQYFLSDIYLPELISVDIPKEAKFVEIKEGKTPRHLLNILVKKPLIEVSKTEILLKYAPEANYWIMNGTEIIVEPFLHANARDIRNYLLGSAIAAIFHQQNKLLLHMSGIDINGFCIGFTGESGAGKSTIAKAFHEKGYAYTTDDIAFVEELENKAIIYSSFPRIKLWKDALKNFSISTSQLEPDLYRSEKYHVDNIKDFSCKPLIFKHFFELIEEDIDKPKIVSLSKKEALIVFMKNTYRRNYIDWMDKTATHFFSCHYLAENVKVHKVIRKKDFDQLPYIIKLIENMIEDTQ